jgi:predicted dehydrogenase
MTTTTGWGIVGTGRVAHLFAEGLADAPGARVAAVASRTVEGARAFAAHFGGARVHGDAAELASDPAVDLVYVAAPNADHHATTLAVLHAGKPVLCEKPFTVDAVQAREVVAAARAHRVFCMEAMWTRFLPAVRELVERARSGELGALCGATIELGHPMEYDASSRLFAPAGGGALLDVGTYAVHVAHLLFGPPVGVRARATRAASGVDLHTTALLEHAGGALSSLSASLRCALSNEATVSGTRARALLHAPLYRPEAISLTPVPAMARGEGQPRPTGAIRHRLRGAVHLARSAAPAALRGTKTLVRPCKGNGYQYQAIEAMRCLRAGELESPFAPLDATVAVMETLDAIRARSREA